MGAFASCRRVPGASSGRLGAGFGRRPVVRSRDHEGGDRSCGIVRRVLLLPAVSWSGSRPARPCSGLRFWGRPASGRPVYV